MNPLKFPFISKKNALLSFIIFAILIFSVSKIFVSKKTPTQYQTVLANRGSLISTVSSSGNITTGNNLTISTNATGTVNKVYVKNGDKVSQGQKIADITLDQDGLQKQASAWASYLSAKNSLANAQNNLNALQITLFQTNQKFINDAVLRSLPPEDPTWIEENAAWLNAENAYKNQTIVINAAQAQLTSSWYNYQQYSGTITAPTAGLITNLTIAPGSVITSSTNSSTNTTTSQQVATIMKEQDNLQAEVNLSEIDVPKVQAGQKVTITMDAFPGQTFTGKVLVINTNGSMSSGVTNYPATIVFDSSLPNMYPNMAVAVKIITSLEDNVILVPSTAVQTSNDQYFVRVMKNDQLSNVNVEVGNSNDTQTVIKSGINEGDEVVIGTISSATAVQTNNTTGSIFGSFGGGARGAAVFRRD